MIFETQRLRIRLLTLNDLDSFHKMQSNPKVMQYADGEVNDFIGHQKELLNLIDKYQNRNNDFWIYAIDHKIDEVFVGTLAFVKDNADDEIGYRFLEEYWNKGYGLEVCKGALAYCRKIGMKQLVAYCADENKASIKILEKLNFKVVERFNTAINQLTETKYKIHL
jgi:ribosomal-protein-alanine N-acetyltransferase